MKKLEQFPINLLNWYTQHARPFLVDFLPPDKLTEFDRHSKSLQEHLSNLNKELVVCFLGSSGVGKSTLLNALIDGKQPLVPSGGVGPLTAQALTVQYAQQPKLEVVYYGVGILHQTYFGLEQMYKAELGTPVSDEVDESLVDGLDETDLPDTGVGMSGDSDIEDPEKLHKREQWRRRAQLLVTGSQDQEREPRYLIDSLLDVVGKPRRWGTSAREEDQKQLAGIRTIINLMRSQGNEVVVTYDAQDLYTFKQRVHDHAAGYMAPLIKTLTIHWPAPILQDGLILIDLPGVGILRDTHKEVTRKWIRDKKTKALVLVVDHRGITDAVGQALRQSEFLNTLLYSVDEPNEEPVLIVAVTRIDDIASTKYTSDKSKRKFQHFLEISEEVRIRMQSDLKKQLDQLWLQNAEVTEARRQVAHKLLDTLQVHPVSAPEYNRLLDLSEDEHPFLQNIEQTGIPDFAQSLQSFAAQHKQNLLQRINAQADLFRDSIVAQLKIIEADWDERIHASDEAAHLQSELALFLQPRREELHRRQGAFHQFLTIDVPHRIQDQVNIASKTASLSIERYLSKLDTAHWATLRASVRRGGRYKGASTIDLPTEFALRFEEPIADAWSKKILVDVRTHTRDYSQDCIALASELKTWIENQAGHLQLKGVQAQHEALQASAKKMEIVGKEMAREMRDEARSLLIDVIEKEIRQVCTAFVAANYDVGPGVKHRILEMHRDLASKVVSVAELPARKLLQNVYKAAKDEIQSAYSDFQDPLTPMAEAIIGTDAQRTSPIDIRRQEKVATTLRVITAELADLS